MSEDGKEIVVELNFGDGKYYPGGSSASIMIKLLIVLPLYQIVVGSLERSYCRCCSILMESTCSHMSIPMLIVDIHQSHIHPPIVEYINKKTTNRKYVFVDLMPQLFCKLAMHQNKIVL